MPKKIIKIDEISGRKLMEFMKLDIKDVEKTAKKFGRTCEKIHFLFERLGGTDRIEIKGEVIIIL
jgi:hypothetical protein